MAAPLPGSPWLEAIASTHQRAWRDLAEAAATVAQLPAVTWGSLWGPQPPAPPAPAPAPAVPDSRLVELEGAIARLNAAALAREAAQERLIGELRASYARLEREAAEARSRAAGDLAVGLYEGLETLLTQLPGVRHAVARGAEVAAGDLLALLAPLEPALAELGLSPIGNVGEPAAFDPALHQLNTGGSAAPGAPVTLRQVGYRHGDRVLRRARVALAPAAGP